MAGPEYAADEVPDRIADEAVHLDDRHAAPRAGKDPARRFRMSLRRAVSCGMEARDDSSPAHAHVGNSQLHGASGVARDDDGAENHRADDWLLPRPAAAVDAGREVRLQQFG